MVFKCGKTKIKNAVAALIVLTKLLLFKLMFLKVVLQLLYFNVILQLHFSTIFCHAFRKGTHL